MLQVKILDGASGFRVEPYLFRVSRGLGFTAYGEWSVVDCKYRDRFYIPPLLPPSKETFSSTSAALTDSSQGHDLQ